MTAPKECFDDPFDDGVRPAGADRHGDGRRPVPATAQAGGDLAAVQRSLQALTTMTADFTQTDRAGKVLTGTLTMKKPGKIRFQYEKGVPLLIVADGGALTFIDYSVRQCSAGRSRIRRSAC